LNQEGGNVFDTAIWLNGTTEIFESTVLPIADIPDWRKQRRV